MAAGREALVDHHGVARQRLGHLQGEPIRIDRRRPGRALEARRRSARLAVQLLLASCGQRRLRPAGEPLAALPRQQRRQRQQRLAQIGPHGHLGGEVLAHVPVDEADVDDRQRRRAAARPRSTPTCAPGRRRARPGDRISTAARAPASGRARARRRSRHARTGNARRRGRSAGRRVRPASAANAAAASSASLLTTSSPTMMTGRSAATSRLARLSSTASAGRERVSTRVEDRARCRPRR